MSSSNFTGPITFGEKTGLATTQTIGFVKGVIVLGLSSATKSATRTMPINSTITQVGFIPTSAFTGADVSACNVTFANGTLVHAIVPASAATRIHMTAAISAANYDTGGTITVTLSADNTTTFTGGGGRAYIEYIVTE